MIFNTRIMERSNPVGEFLFDFDLVEASVSVIKEALRLNDSYADVYRRDVFRNINAIREAARRGEG
jgi:hypothetical protein